MGQIPRRRNVSFAGNGALPHNFWCVDNGSLFGLDGQTIPLFSVDKHVAVWSRTCPFRKTILMLAFKSQSNTPSIPTVTGPQTQRRSPAGEPTVMESGHNRTLSKGPASYSSKEEAFRSAKTAPKPLGRLLLLVGMLAFFLMPMGHGCGITHKHPGEDDDDGVAFRLRQQNSRVLSHEATKKPSP